MPNNTRQLFMSDLHLEDPTSRQFVTFAAILRANADADIYLLGDLCEVWVGDDDDGPLAQALYELLTATAKTTNVYLVHGNRDFLFGNDFSNRTGVQLLPDPYRISNDVLVAHGDGYCIDDVPYQNMRTMLRSADWQASILQQSLAARREFARDLRERSQATNANKAQNIMDVNQAAVASACAEHGTTRLIHGHTHRPGRHQHDGLTRTVLGDWDHCAWVATHNNADAATTLWRLPLTDHCENESWYRLE